MDVRTLTGGIVACLAMVSLAVRAADPIANYEQQPVPASGGVPSVEQVRNAIMAAGASRRWKMSDAGPGKLVGSLSVRNRHQVEVNIDYDPQRYSITYRNSVNMGYSAASRTIHANYNVWVNDLRQGINASLALVKPGPASSVALQPATPPAPAVTAVGGELPRAGDSWSYRLSDPKRRQGERGVFVKVASASGGAIVDHVSVEGGFTTPLTHAPGGYLVMQGPSVFSPYFAVFQRLEPGAALAGIRVVDPGCKDVYVCEAKGSVAGAETVELPAGRFKAVKVVIEQRWRPVFASRGNQPAASSRTLTVWYVPEIKRAVKYSSRLTGANPAPIDADFDLALASYTVSDAPPAAAAADRTEIAFWESVRDSKNPAELQAYLDRYPGGTFAPLARARLSALGAAK